jgi:hypothetical protein
MRYPYGQLRRIRHARRGVAMLECALVLPLLVFFLVAIMLMGWGMQNRQQTEISARLIGWSEARGVTHSDVPEHYGRSWGTVIRDHLLSQRNDEGATTVADAERAYLYDSEGVQIDTMNTIEDWVQRVIIEDEDAGGAAELWILGSDHWPWGHGAAIEARFPVPWRYWAHLDDKHVETWFIRDGVEWRYSQIHNEQVIADEFLSDVDEALQSVEDPGDALAAQFRWMYLAEW